MKVSIILPVYNAENSISHILKSLLAQTMKDFEILLINDGSTDQSGIICNEIATKDTRIRVFHKQNEGVSAARQLGLDNANGEYIIHADSDDYVDATMLEEMYNKAKEENADVVISDFFSTTQDGKDTLVKQKPSALDHHSILNDLFQQLHGSCWNKLVKRVCYSKYNIHFPKGLNYCEDLLTWIELYTHPIKTSYLSKAFYHYVQNPSSITRNFTLQKYQMRCDFADKLEKVLPKDIRIAHIENVRIGIFTEAYSFKVLSGMECRKQFYPLIIKAIKNSHSIRWKLGYIFILMRLDKLARIMLNYK